MNASVRAILVGGLGAAFLFACSRRPTPEPTASTSDSRGVTVSEVVNHVEARASASAASAPVANGYALGVGGQLTTGEASTARLDFSDGTILRVAEKSSFTLQSLSLENDPLKRLQLEIGTLWVSLPAGTLEVETPVGVASVRGSFAIIRYDPGDPDDPDDDLLVVDCLEGSCSAHARGGVGEAEMGNLERVVLNRSGHLRMTLTGEDVQAFLKTNSEGERLVALLTAAPPATTTPLSTATATSRASPTPTPTQTFTRVHTATAIVLASPSPSRTPTATARLATAAPLLGRHSVRAGETLFCIGRAYTVLPAAIAQANELVDPSLLITGQTLSIPAVRWVNVIPGPVCAAQFASPFNPGSATARATGSPTGTQSPTPTPTATCEPGSFYDPFQKRCRPPDTSVPAVSSTPPNTPIPPPSSTPLPSNTPLPTNTPTQTDTPLPDTLGPTITMPQAVPVNVVGDGTTQCPVTFQADLSDPSGVGSARVVWTAFDSGGTPTSNSNVSMTLFSGDSFTGVWQAPLNVPIVAGGKLTWDVQAFDTIGNFQSINTSPTWDIMNTGSGDCLP